MEPPSVITNTKTRDHETMRPRELTSDSEGRPNTTTISREQRNAVIKVCRELLKCNFRDVDKLQNKAMYFQ